MSDNAKAFESLLYTVLLGLLDIKVRHTTPGCPWENPYAESLIGTLRAYLYPPIQRQKTVAGKAEGYNHRTHWEFRHDDVKTPLGKMGQIKGRPMPGK